MKRGRWLLIISWCHLNLISLRIKYNIISPINIFIKKQYLKNGEPKITDVLSPAKFAA
jgi:hypothetical protein